MVPVPFICFDFGDSPLKTVPFFSAGHGFGQVEGGFAGVVCYLTRHAEVKEAYGGPCGAFDNSSGFFGDVFFTELCAVDNFHG